MRKMIFLKVRQNTLMSFSHFNSVDIMKRIVCIGSLQVTGGYFTYRVSSSSMPYWSIKYVYNPSNLRQGKFGDNKNCMIIGTPSHLD